MRQSYITAAALIISGGRVQYELLLLRLIHILGGVFWVGTAMFNTFFLVPAMVKAGPAAGAVSAGLAQRKLFVWLPIVAVLTMLSGLRLMMLVSGGNSDWFLHRSGHVFSISGALAIIAFIVGMVVSRPAMMKAGKLSQTAASDETSKKLIAGELAKLQKRAAVGNAVAVVLLLLAAMGMAIARYV
jgi:uncharacterized membrane protein